MSKEKINTKRYLPINTLVANYLQQLSDLSFTGDAPYHRGLFPSQRYHPFLPYNREDDNLFFSATVAFTLQAYVNIMDDKERKWADSIIESVRVKLHFFQNKDGKPTFNFWQTQPTRHFPNGVFMHHFEHFRIPDDADDTALAHLLLHSKKETVGELMTLFERHANTTRKTINNTWLAFKNLKAISTFFGEKMRIEFDAVVMCNALLFLLEHFNTDEKLIEDSIAYIDGILKKDYHISNPFQAAPNYPTSQLIIYHVARLLQKHPNCGLEIHRDKMIGQLNTLLKMVHTPVSKIICINALWMLNPQEEKMDVVITTPTAQELLNDKKGYFFHAGMLSAFENNLAQRLSTNSFFHLRYRCEALNLVLLIENELLKRKPVNVN